MRERWLTAYTVNFHALFLGRSYIWSLLNQFITLIRSSCSKKKKKGGGVCVRVLFIVEHLGWYWHSYVVSCGNFSILLVSIKTSLHPPESLFCHAPSTDVSDLILDTSRKSFNTLEILLFLVSSYQTFRHQEICTSCRPLRWALTCIFVTAAGIFPSWNKRLKKNSGVGILVVTVTFWEFMHLL